MNRGGVFYLQSTARRQNRAAQAIQASAVQFRDVVFSVIAALIVVVGVSGLLHMVDSRVSDRAPRRDEGQTSWYAPERYLAVFGVSIAEAATVNNADSVTYYQKNLDLYNKKSVSKVASKTAVKKVAAPAKKVAVIKKAVVVASASKTSAPALAATKLIQSTSALTLAPWEEQVFTVGFKNTGKTTWSVGRTDTVRLQSAAKKESYFYGKSWESKTVAVSLKEAVAPGQIGYFTVTMAAPATHGNFTENFALYAGSQKVVGSEIVLPVAVSGAPIAMPAVVPSLGVPAPQVLAANEQRPAANPVKEASAMDNASTTNTVASSVSVATPVSNASTFVPTGVVQAITMTEPQIRVGFTNSKDPSQITASQAYEVRDTAGALLVSAAAGSVTSVVFEPLTKQFAITNGATAVVSPLAVRFAAPQGVTIDPASPMVFEVLSYTARPAWNQSLNDNKFRNVIEIRYSTKTDKVWLINELQLEDYLKGLAETSNSSHAEYQKALIIAARTYAYYHIMTNTKYASEGFTVRNTDADQVYRGYGSEVRMPNLTAAINATRGVMVHYDGKLAITPYFSNSDGRTRTWTEVWGGSHKPWLVGVDDPGSAGMKMWGHGVGMSAKGALVMAGSGKGFEEILKHYYTGVQLHQIY